jgi:hypothetical protein
VAIPTLYAKRLEANERNLQRFINDLAQQVLKSEFVHGFEVSDNQLYDSLVQRVLKSGMKFAAGTDMCWHYPGKTCGQATTSRFPTLHKAGMSSLDVIAPGNPAVTASLSIFLTYSHKYGSMPK